MAAIPIVTTRPPDRLVSVAEEEISSTLFPFIQSAFAKDRHDIQQFPVPVFEPWLHLLRGKRLVLADGVGNFDHTVMQTQGIVAFGFVIGVTGGRGGRCQGQDQHCGKRIWDELFHGIFSAATVDVIQYQPVQGAVLSDNNSLILFICAVPTECPFIAKS